MNILVRILTLNSIIFQIWFIMYGSKGILTLLDLKSKGEIKSKDSLYYVSFDVNFEKNITNFKYLVQIFCSISFLNSKKKQK